MAGIQGGMGMELWAIVPELTLAALVLLLLPLGAFLPAERRDVATWMALAGLVVVAGESVRMLFFATQPVFLDTYAVDQFAVYFKLFAVATTALVLLATQSHFRGRPHEGEVPALLLLVCLGIMGLAASQDLALIALFIQMVTVGSYILVGIAKENRSATEAALKMFLFSATVGAVMIYGMVLLFGLTGTLRLPELASKLPAMPVVTGRVGVPGREQAMRTQQKVIVVGAGHNVRPEVKWLADLLQHGLLRPSFVHPAWQREVRELTRYRTRLIEERSRAVNRLQKILEGANIKLTSVASDVMGVSARAMMQALLQGEVDPNVLAQLARGSMRSKRDLLAQERPRRFTVHHRFLISEQLAHIDSLDETIAHLSSEIAERLHPFEEQLKRLETIPGIKRRLAEVILAEIGADMSRFPSARPLARLRRHVSRQQRECRQALEWSHPQRQSLAANCVG